MNMLYIVVMILWIGLSPITGSVRLSYYLESERNVPERMTKKINQATSSIAENGLHRFYETTASFSVELHLQKLLNVESNEKLGLLVLLFYSNYWSSSCNSAHFLTVDNFPWHFVMHLSNKDVYLLQVCFILSAFFWHYESSKLWNIIENQSIDLLAVWVNIQFLKIKYFWSRFKLWIFQGHRFMTNNKNLCRRWMS